MSTRVCAVFCFYHSEINQDTAPVPILPFDIVAYAYRLLRDNLSQNSCSQNNQCFPYLVKFKSLRSCFGLSRNYDHVNKLTSVFIRLSCY